MIDFDTRIYTIAKGLRATGLLMDSVEALLVRSVHESIELLANQERAEKQ